MKEAVQSLADCLAKADNSNSVAFVRRREVIIARELLRAITANLRKDTQAHQIEALGILEQWLNKHCKEK